MKVGDITFREDSTGYLAGMFYLNHSCDEWVIGNLEQAKKFQADLGQLIEEVERLERS